MGRRGGAALIQMLAICRRSVVFKKAPFHREFLPYFISLKKVKAFF
jgi:hypothetical protein